jgi:hypothetical protein
MRVRKVPSEHQPKISPLERDVDIIFERRERVCVAKRTEALNESINVRPCLADEQNEGASHRGDFSKWTSAGDERLATRTDHERIAGKGQAALDCEPILLVRIGQRERSGVA